jgi:elongation of very long chain fatty acids protein 6
MPTTRSCFLTFISPGTSWATVYAQPFHDYWYLFWLAAVAYLPTIALLRRVMRDRKPLQLKPLLVLWNGGLAALSIAMCAACIPYCVELWSTYSWRESICFNRHYGLHRGTSWAFAWMGYSKVLELFDTVLLALRRKPIILLHWYHHVSVLLFVWFSQVAAQTNAHIVYTLMNCIVHRLCFFVFSFSLL